MLITGSRVHLQKSRRSRVWRGGVGVLTAATLTLATPAGAEAAPAVEPDLGPALAGFSELWTASGKGDLHGRAKNQKVLARNDRLAVWINRNATEAQQFRALQDAMYQNSTATSYDQSLTLSTGLGSVLGPLYRKGRTSGALPLTSALINSSDGTSGAHLNVNPLKTRFSYPRPYLPSNSDTAAVPGFAEECDPSKVSGSSLRWLRLKQPYATAKGNLRIKRVTDRNDTTHQFAPNDVYLSAGYGSAGLCTGGSFPSGHGTTAYQAGLTLATLLPELAPEILARTSEAGNNRLVLGVHYPLDVMGGRIAAQASLAAQWSDKEYRTKVLEPARRELVRYLKQSCKSTLAKCIARQKSYRSNPYGGKKMPGGTAQLVTGRKSALKVYRERLTYGFPREGKKKFKASVPAGAANLLLTTFPTLTKTQRTSVLAQTQIPSGYPLDRSGHKGKSWQRLDLAAAMSATVKVSKKTGKVKVVSTGGPARVRKG
ncbi:phosphatase PAP2 family protein [Kineosporia babensis]|uniref:Phosphatase PAP2 family protein n=1 Tax=Kineosporia babensis TaxID=499548 RepID=A0A9X1NBX6_9ACTN|nr:phosphatase PAP2 family protein [Kineosporia babensis]